MVKDTLKILRCEYNKSLKVCLIIFLFSIKHKSLNWHKSKLLNNTTKRLFFVEKHISYFNAW